MIASAIASATPNPAATGPDGASDASDITFSDVLHALNPLQYVPVVGTIYRAVSGDTLPEPLRVMGGMVTGGLMGGPIGVAVSAAGSLLQHVTGIDLDHVAHDVLASIGLVEDAPAEQPAAMVAAVPSGAGSATAAEGPGVESAEVRMALAAYGQTLGSYGPGAGHA